MIDADFRDSNTCQRKLGIVEIQEGYLLIDAEV